MNPRLLQKLNGWATLVWVVMIVPTVLFWRQSILWVAFMSIWANVVSHYTAWLAARVHTETLEAQ